jgi:hypothetical protein
MTRQGDFTHDWLERAQECCSRIEYGPATNVQVLGTARKSWARGVDADVGRSSPSTMSAMARECPR